MAKMYYLDIKGRKGQIDAQTRSAAKMQLAEQGIEVEKFITAAEFNKKTKTTRKLTTVVGDVKKRITDFGLQYLDIKNKTEQLKNEQKGKFIDSISSLQDETHSKVIEVLGSIGENIADQAQATAAAQNVTDEQIQQVSEEKEDKVITDQVKSSFSAQMAKKVLGSGNKLESQMVQKALEKKEKERERTTKVRCASVSDYQKFLKQFEEEKGTVVIVEADHHDTAAQLKNKIKMWFANAMGKKIVVLQSANAEAARDLKKFDTKSLQRGKMVEAKQDNAIFEVTKQREKTGDILTDINNAANDWLIDITPIKTADMVTFYQLLNVMINAGVPLIRSLQELINQTKNPHLRKILIDMLYAIENGSTFSSALGAYPKYFDNAQRGVIKAGEASGSLGDTLKRLAADMEKSAKMAAKIRGAMIYPIAVICILVGVGIVVMVMIVPKLTKLFGDPETLPASTKNLIAISDFFINNGMYLFVGVAVFVVIFKKYIQTDSGRFVWHFALLKIPVFGKLNQKVAIARFTHSLSALSASGVSLIKGLQINADAVGNEVFRREILYTIESVEKGMTIHEDLAQSKLFPPMVVNMIGIGEETAQLGSVAEKIAEYYDDEVDNLIKNLSTLMEPIIIVVLGVSVALLVSAIMEPIMQISDKAVGMISLISFV